MIKADRAGARTRSVVLGAIAALAGSVSVAAPSGAATTWTVRTQPTAKPVQAHAQFSAVSCPSSTFCLAVGSRVAVDGSFAALTETYDGTKWKVVSAPIAGAEGLRSVSCVSASFCAATTNGGAADNAVDHVVRWNGHGWVTQSLGGAKVDYLSDVQCRSTSNCTLVGTVSQQAAAWHYNGKGWFKHAVPNAANRALSAVSCPATSVCFAAGSVTVGGSAGKPYVARWNGAKWTAVTLPSVAGLLQDISCVSTTRCTAVGSRGTNQDSVLVADLRSGKWHYSSVKTKRYYPSGEAVACTAAGSCTMIMNFERNEAVAATIAVRGKAGGFTTSTQSTPDLGGLSCAGYGCVIVGSTLVFDRSGFSIADNPTYATAFKRSGTKLVKQTVPQPDSRTANQLTAVSCAGAGMCVAIGGAQDPTAIWRRPQSGAAWAAVAGSAGKTYTGVSCPSATFCMVVGTGTSRSFDGTSWTTHAIPQPDGKGKDEIAGVSCVSSTWCDAVGTTGRFGDENKVLVMHWNGTTWAQIAAPSPTSVLALASISCTATNFCLAVGYGYGSESEVPLVEQWNGLVWSHMSTTGIPAKAGLHAVSCWSSTGCMVTSPGDYGDGVVASWNGATFTAQTVLGSQPTINAVSCTSATSCTIAGLRFVSQRTIAQLVERWNGSGFSIVEQPVISGDQPEFNGISCTTTDGRCTAVGDVTRAYTVGLVASGTV